MVHPHIVAEVAAWTPDRLRCELALAIPELNLRDARRCDWLACLLRRQSELLSAPVAEQPLEGIAAEIKEALQGDSNDAEHDALVSVAEHLGITWQPPDE
jgi:hypothetical protein